MRRAAAGFTDARRLPNAGIAHCVPAIAFQGGGWDVRALFCSQGILCVSVRSGRDARLLEDQTNRKSSTRDMGVGRKIPSDVNPYREHLIRFAAD
jgi:hypothetical protein